MKSIISVSTRTLLFQLFVAALLFFTPLPLHADQTICSAVLSPDVSFQIPKVTMGDLSLYANFQQVPTNDGSIVLRLTGYGETNRTDCSDRDTAMFMTTTDESAWILHIPSLMIGQAQYWVNLQYVPADNGELWFRVLNYGPGGDWNNRGGIFMALAKSEVLSESDTSYRLRLTFPMGIQTEYGLSLVADQTYTPTAEELAGAAQNPQQIFGVQVANAGTADTFTSRFSFFVPYSALPPAVLSKIQPPVPVQKQATAQSYQLMQSAGAEQSGGSYVQYVVETVGAKGDEEAIKAGAEEFLGDKVVAAGGFIKDFAGWWEIRTEHLGWFERLDAVQECVENYDWASAPVNLKEVYLESIKNTREQIKTNTATRFMTAAQEAALGIVPASWIPMSVYTDKVNEGIKRENELMVQLEESKLKCNKRYVGTVHHEWHSGGTNQKIIIDANVTFTLDPEQSSPYRELYFGKGTATISWAPYKNGNLSCDGKSVTFPTDLCIDEPMKGNFSRLEINPTNSTYYGFGTCSFAPVITYNCYSEHGTVKVEKTPLLSWFVTDKEWQLIKLVGDDGVISGNHSEFGYSTDYWNWILIPK